MNQISARRTIFLFLLLVIVGTTSCGPMKRIQPDFQKPKSPLVAILPANYPPGISRERIDLLQQLLFAELENEDFLVLTNDVVLATCSSDRCPERSSLFEQYQVAQFVSLSLESIAQTDFLAGYYNSLAGSLQVTDVNNKELLHVQHRESERGGLLFDSGQVLDSIRAPYQNAVGERFGLLAVKFIKRIVSEIPSPILTETDSLPTPPEIRSVSNKKIADSVVEICASGSPHGLAYLIGAGVRANLRNTDAETYCGIFRTSAPPLAGMNSVTVELRSPIGLSSTRELTLSPSAACLLPGRIVAEPVSQGYQLQTENCSPTSANAACSDLATTCPDTTFVLYRAAQKEGPYLKAKTLQPGAWHISAPNKDAAYYQVVATSDRGSSSLPIAVDVLPGAK